LVGISLLKKRHLTDALLALVANFAARKLCWIAKEIGLDIEDLT